MSHRKWRETKQQLIWWPDLTLLGCSLVSLHFQCDILAPITVTLVEKGHGKKPRLTTLKRGEWKEGEISPPLAFTSEKCLPSSSQCLNLWGKQIHDPQKARHINEKNKIFFSPGLLSWTKRLYGIRTEKRTEYGRKVNGLSVISIYH